MSKRNRGEMPQPVSKEMKPPVTREHEEMKPPVVRESDEQDASKHEAPKQEVQKVSEPPRHESPRQEPQKPVGHESKVVSHTDEGRDNEDMLAKLRSNFNDARPVYEEAIDKRLAALEEEIEALKREKEKIESLSNQTKVF